MPLYLRIKCGKYTIFNILKFKLGSEAWGINKRNHIVKKQTGQKAIIYNRCHSLMANKYCKHKVGSHLRWLLPIVFHWQSSRCDLSRTKRVGRNGIPLRSIFACCILLRCWWSKCNCDFKDLGKKKNHCWEKSEDNLIQTRLGSLKKTTKGLTKKVRVIFFASGRSIVISQKLCDVCYPFS